MIATLFFVLFNFLASVWLSSTLLYVILCLAQKTTKRAIAQLKIGLGGHLVGLICLLAIIVMYDQAQLSVWFLSLTALMDISIFVLSLVGVHHLIETQ